MTTALFLASLAVALCLGVILGLLLGVVLGRADRDIDERLARHDRDVAVNDEADMGEAR